MNLPAPPPLTPAPPPLASPRPSMAAAPWGLAAILAGLAVPLVLWGSSLAFTLAGEVPEDLSDADAIASIILSILILDGAFVAAPVAFAIWRYRAGWTSLGFRPLDGELIWLPFVAAVIAYFGTIVYGAILALLGATPEQDVDQLFDSRVVLPLTALATIIVAPLAEELFFRGFVFGGLVRYVGANGAMAASGLLFALFHVSDAQSALLVPPFAAIGVLFAWLYYRTGSLWASVLCHFLFNLITFSILTIVELTGSAS